MDTHRNDIDCGCIEEKSEAINRPTLRHRPRAAIFAALATTAGLGTTATTYAADPVLEEVVVTARYREENLQETPIAITAVTADALEVRSIDNVQDLGTTVPNAYIRPNPLNFGPAPSIGIRGAIQSDFYYTFDPAVGVYIDDVYHGTLTGSSFDLMDLDRIEVLRGPQGTLFGKNSLGGAIRLISKKPQGDNSGTLEVTYGDFNRLEVKGSYDFALVPDKLFMRMAGVSKRREGYVDRLDFTCEMIRRGTPQLAGLGDGLGPDGADADLDPDVVAVGSAQDTALSFPQIRAGNNGNCKLGTLGGQDLEAARVMLRYVASPALEFNLATDYSNDESEPAVGTSLGGQANTGNNIAYNSQVIFRRFGIRYDTDLRFVTGDPFTTYATFADPISGQVWPIISGVEAWGTSASMDWRVADKANVKAIVAYRTYDTEFSSDSDYTPLDLNTTYNILEHEQWTAELQITGSAFDDKLEWTTGGFYYDAKSFIGGRVELEPFNFSFNPTTGAGGPPYFNQNDRFEGDNKSVFAHLVFHFTDRLSAAAGGRYSEESKTFAFDHTGYLTVARPSVTGEERVDWKVGLDYKLTDDMFLYTQAATGFRSPAFNPRPFAPGQLAPVTGEEITSYEIGLKADLFDRRLRMNTSVYYSDYDPRRITRAATQCNPASSLDPGQPFFLATGAPCPAGTPLAGVPGLPWFVYTSVPAVDKGVELELTASPIDGLAINGAVGTNKFEADDRHEDSLIQPEWNASVGVQYEIVLGNAGTLTPRVDWSYLSHMTNNANVANRPLDPDNIIPSYQVYNARLAYESSNGEWSAALLVSNVFDKFYYYNLAAATARPRQASPGEPRQWAITLKRKF
jgi:iron complex outermembrane recepter protein